MPDIQGIQTKILQRPPPDQQKSKKNCLIYQKREKKKEEKKSKQNKRYSQSCLLLFWLSTIIRWVIRHRVSPLKYHSLNMIFALGESNILFPVGFGKQVETRVICSAWN